METTETHEMPFIRIKQLFVVDGDKKYEIPVPAGISELLQNCWTTKPRVVPEIVKQYDRKVVFENGELTTILTKKQTS